MAIVKAKPTSPGRRFVVKVVNEDLHKGAPYEPLLEASPDFPKADVLHGSALPLKRHKTTD